MTTIKEIQNRVVLVDYFPASHGHFLIDTLHSMMYTNVNHRVINFEKNYHGSNLVPNLYRQEQNSETPFVDFKFNQHFLDKFPGDNHIFWPAHWSIYWYNKKIATGIISLPDFNLHINNIPIIEIYSPSTIWFRYYINYWFNLGIYSKQQLADNEFFVNNFYQHCKHIGNLDIFNNDKALVITQNPEQHRFTQTEILDMIEESIFINHGYSNKLENAAWYRTLPNLPISNNIFSISMDAFYEFNLFNTTILQINDFFKLNCNIEVDKLKDKWNKFINVQQPINVYNSTITDNHLTLVEQAYRNFLRKCQ